MTVWVFREYHLTYMMKKCRKMMALLDRQHKQFSVNLEDDDADMKMEILRQFLMKYKILRRLLAICGMWRMSSGI